MLANLGSWGAASIALALLIALLLLYRDHRDRKRDWVVTVLVALLLTHAVVQFMLQREQRVEFRREREALRAAQEEVRVEQILQRERREKEVQELIELRAREARKKVARDTPSFVEGVIESAETDLLAADRARESLEREADRIRLQLDPFVRWLVHELEEIGKELQAHGYEVQVNDWFFSSVEGYGPPAPMRPALGSLKIRGSNKLTKVSIYMTPGKLTPPASFTEARIRASRGGAAVEFLIHPERSRIRVQESPGPAGMEEKIRVPGPPEDDRFIEEAGKAIKVVVRRAMHEAGVPVSQ